jgi:hypothetical protein
MPRLHRLLVRTPAATLKPRLDFADAHLVGSGNDLGAMPDGLAIDDTRGAICPEP